MYHEDDVVRISEDLKSIVGSNITVIRKDDFYDPEKTEIPFTDFA